MGNSYPSKIGTKLDNSVCPDYRPDGRVRPGHLTGLQNRTSDTHSNAAKIACCMQRLPTLADRDDAGRQGSRTFADARPIGQMPPNAPLAQLVESCPPKQDRVSDPKSETPINSAIIHARSGQKSRRSR